MFGIGETELIIIVVFAFMIFGPDKLPGMGRTIGRALRQFREAQEGFSQVVQAEVVDPLTGAMNEPAARKRAQVAAQAAAEDADIDADVPASGGRAETFAERKARLRAEREARDAAAAPPVEGDTTPDVDGPAAEEASGPMGDSAVPQTSAAALYAMAPRATAAGRGPATANDAPAENGTPSADAIAHTADGEEAESAE